ncbi:hypothetical protein BJ165DRAFT_1472197 [Panaeolus papilionaceus]|nr:hypothetical protein BJ165DRAFT_1472197 [Panaeolus papilionaceus]
MVPVEILDLIINEVEQAAFLDRFDTLKRCALVCRLFSSICRPRIFRRIKIDDEFDTFFDQNGGMYRLVKLAQVLKDSPHLLHLVKEFSFGPWPRIDDTNPLSLDLLRQLPCHQDAFFLFPDLQMLKVEDSTYNRDKNISSLSQLCDTLVETYSSTPSVHTISIISISTLLHRVFSSPYLRTLHLEHVDFLPDNILGPYSLEVTHLTIAHTYDCPYPVLSFFPYLEILELRGIHCFNRPEQPYTFPSKLRELQIVFGSEADTDAMNDFIANCTTPTPAAFQFLERLTVSCDIVPDLNGTQSLIDRCPSLKYLHIRANESDAESKDIFQILDLDNLVRSRLTEMAIWFPEHANPNDLASTLTRLQSHFSQVSGQNNLKTLKILLKVWPESRFVPQFPCEDSWSPIAETLALRTNFPKLHEVDIHVRILVLRKDETDEADNAEYMRRLQALMGKLVSRQDIIFHYRIERTTLRDL